MDFDRFHHTLDGLRHFRGRDNKLVTGTGLGLIFVGISAAWLSTTFIVSSGVRSPFFIYDNIPPGFTPSKSLNFQKPVPAILPVLPINPTESKRPLTLASSLARHGFK